MTRLSEVAAFSNGCCDVKPLTAVIVPLCTAALAAEVLLPWCLVWLSDRFLFDIPGWSLWLVFAGPHVAGLGVISWQWAALRRARAGAAGRRLARDNRSLASSA